MLQRCAHSSGQFGLAKVANGPKFGLANKIINWRLQRQFIAMK